MNHIRTGIENQPLTSHAISCFFIPWILKPHFFYWSSIKIYLTHSDVPFPTTWRSFGPDGNLENLTSHQLDCSFKIAGASHVISCFSFHGSSSLISSTGHLSKVPGYMRLTHSDVPFLQHEISPPFSPNRNLENLISKLPHQLDCSFKIVGE